MEEPAEPHDAMLRNREVLGLVPKQTLLTSLRRQMLGWRLKQVSISQSSSGAHPAS